MTDADDLFKECSLRCVLLSRKLLSHERCECSCHKTDESCFPVRVISKVDVQGLRDLD